MAARVGLRQRLFDKTSPLPPQVSLRHISAISICSVVGTGVYISSLSTSLRDAGPAGVFIAYVLTATIVYCTAVSNGEMMAHLPNVGGPVGLADVFVDPALGFAMGWNAWYHWSIIVPTQLAAAGRLAKTYVSSQTPVANSTFYASIALFLVLAVGLNFIGARRFGQVHVAFALLKMFTLVVLIFVALIIDWTPVRRCNAFPGSTGCPAPDTPNVCARQFALPPPANVVIGGAYWRCPGPFVQPFGTKGIRGSIAGVFTVLVQACFSFFGTEIAGVPGREIQNPTTNIPRAIRRVWFRIALLYILAVLAAGLVVPSNDDGLGSDSTPPQSPWIIALHIASATTVPRYLLFSLFMISAFSAASSDVYVSSRYLFYLARRGHAPWIFGSVYKGKAKGSLPAYKGPDERRGGGSVMRERTLRDSPATLSRSLSDVAKDSPGSPPEMQSPTSPPSTLPLLHYSHSPFHSRDYTRTHTPSHSRDLSSYFLSPHSPASLSGAVGLVGVHTRHGSQLSGSFSLPVTPPRATAHAHSLTVDTLTSRPNTGQSALSAVTLVSPPDARPDLPQSHSSPAALASPRPPKLKRSKAIAPEPPPDIFIPWVGVLAAGLVGLLVFLAPAAQNDKKVDAAFSFFTKMTNCASLISWVGILVTYLRYYQGTKHAETTIPGFRKDNEESLYKNRPWGQPWLARYALVWCIAILLGQGWTSFTSPGVNRIAELDGDAPVQDSDFDLSFIVNYLPIASFLLLAFGYKLVYQTNFVRLEDMKFERGKVLSGPEELEPPTNSVWVKLYRVLL
ncbi:hypothetical protein AURDEDRAFT_112148, partial [Auricularia subglabra TFB-10046 SS5]